MNKEGGACEGERGPSQGEEGTTEGRKDTDENQQEDGEEMRVKMPLRDPLVCTLTEKQTKEMYSDAWSPEEKGSVLI